MNPAAITVDAANFPVQRLCHWAQTTPDRIYLTQPLGMGQVQDISWAQAADQVRRIAAWLQAQGGPAGSRVAILGKNSAHCVLADLAILMAGHVSVPIYPTFNGEALAYILKHSAARACFVGKMDDSSSLASAPVSVALVALPLAPAGAAALHWDGLLRNNTPLAKSVQSAGADSGSKACCSRLCQRWARTRVCGIPVNLKRSLPPRSVGVSPAEMEAKMAALPGKNGGG